MYESQGFSRLRKRDFFRLFWASWGQAFISKNIDSGFRNTGLHPFNPEIILQRFNQKSESRPSSSGSTASILKAEDWRRIRQLLKETVIDIYEEKAKKLSNTMMSLTTENILLKLRCEGLERALMNEQKRRNRKKPLLLDLPNAGEGGAIFFSPKKVQQARDLQLQKDNEILQEQARKDDKKLQQQVAKESRESEKLQRAQIRQEKRLQRQQEAEEKQRLKAEKQLAKQADSQLQKDAVATPKPPRRPAKHNITQSKQKSSPEAHEEAVEVVAAVNRRGRPIRLPERFR
jgi:hypothetical protein